MGNTVTLNAAEQKAIKKIERLARDFPPSLTLFGWSGNLCVLKQSDQGELCAVAEISGICGDGGDPDYDTRPEITYEDL